MLRRQFVVGFCLLTAVVAPRPAAAQTDPALEADIVRLLDMTGAQALAEQVGVAIFKQMAEVLRTERPDLPGRAIDICAEVVKTAIATNMHTSDGLLARIVPIYAKHFSHVEIRTLIAFYTTGTGRKVVRVMPSLMQESMQLGQEWALRITPQLQAEMERRLRAEGFVKKPPTAAAVERQNLPDPDVYRPQPSEEPYRPGPGIEPPQVLSEVQPDYTAQALKERIEGVVLVECVVLTDGKVGECKVMRPLDPGLDQEAIRAARQWGFVPGSKDGRPVPVLVLLEFTFKVRR